LVRAETDRQLRDRRDGLFPAHILNEHDFTMIR